MINIVCKECNIDKPLTEFYQKIKEDGTILIRKDCKACVKKRTKKWKIEHPERNKLHQITFESKPERIEYLKKNGKRQRESGYRLKWLRSEIGKKKSKIYSTYRTQYKTHIISKSEWNACKKYFNNSCAYCGLPAEQHFCSYRGIEKIHELHKEHIDHEGSNGLDNCVPACRQCNSEKHTTSFEDWYNKDNIKYSEERFLKIIQWLEHDYTNYIDVNKQ